MRSNSLAVAGMHLSVFGFAAVAGGSAARAALVESLPLNGSGNAVVGTGGVGVNGPVAAGDHNGVAGGATSFARTYDAGSYLSVAGGGGLENLQTGTMAFWVKWDGGQRSSYAGGFGAVTARQLNGSVSDDVLALDGSDPSSAHLTFRFDNATQFAVTGSTPVGDGVWNYVAVTFTPTTESLYLNGSLDGSVDGTFDSTGDVGAPLALGAWPDDGYQYSTSTMSDFRVYDTVLTPDQIAAAGGLAAPNGVPEPTSLGTVAAAAVSALVRRRRPR